MTSHEIKRRYPNASTSFLKANSTDHCAGQDTKLERPSRVAPLETHQDQEAAATGFHIRFVSVRKRLCDPDNLAAKWLLDCLRYCGIIDGDEPEKISYEIGQRKCQKHETEHTIIEVTPL